MTTKPSCYACDHPKTSHAPVATLWFSAAGCYEPRCGCRGYHDGESHEQRRDEAA